MERREKVRKELQKEGIDLAILVSPSNVSYCTEFEVPYWPAFMGDMSKGLPMVLAMIGTDSGICQIVASEFYKKKLARANWENAVCYRPFSYEVYDDAEENFKNALVGAIDKVCGKVNRIVIGIEWECCPVCVIEAIRECYPHTVFKNVSKVVERARCIKLPGELAKIRMAAKVADTAQEKLNEISKKPGEYTELDIWFQVQMAVSNQTKTLTPFVGELVTGKRTGLSDYPLGPTGRKVEKGDIAIMDISPRVEGYWADCSNVVVLWDEPNQEQLRYFYAVKDIYEAGREIIRPGVRFVDVNRKMEEMYQKHHFGICSYQGHQIGASVNETPRFTYHEEAVLEEDMVVCIEPQIYTGQSGNTGVRLERMLHVTAEGAEELNHFSWGIEK